MSLEAPEAAETTTAEASETALATSEARLTRTDRQTDGTAASATASATTDNKPIQTIVATSSGMPQGTKIGIGVGVGLGLAIIGLLAAIALLMMKKQKYRKAKEETQNQPEAQDMLPPPPKSPYMEDSANRSFIGGAPAPQVSWQELDGSTRKGSSTYYEPTKTPTEPPVEMESGVNRTKPSGGHLAEME